MSRKLKLLAVIIAIIMAVTAYLTYHVMHDVSKALNDQYVLDEEDDAEIY